ncbi:MAG: hypothetical protein WDZ88_01280 [Candidatus Paceibacterota bacterium]
MSLPDLSKLIKSHAIRENLLQDVLISLLIFLSIFLAFGLGRLSVSSVVKEPVKLENRAFGGGFVSSETGLGASGEVVAGEYVGSKNGSKYHLPWCPGAGQINDENKVWFSSKEDAESRGYTPALNCKGI